MFKSRSKTNLISTHHAEKKFEILATARELVGSGDRGNFIRDRMDNRDLNDDSHFVEGNEETATLTEFTWDKCKPLNVEATMALLKSLSEIQRDLETGGLA